MGHVIPVTLAHAFYVMVSITVAIPLNSENETLDCGYQQSPEEKYSWEKPRFEHYHTIDPNDLKDPSVGVLSPEHLNSYKTEEQTMDLGVFSYHPIAQSSDEMEDSNSAESIDTESRSSNHHIPEQHEEVKEEKIITVVKNVAAPYPVEKAIHYPVVKNIPYPVKVHVPQPYPIEKPIPYPVKVMVKVPVRIPHPYPVYRNTPYAVQVPIERRVPYHVYIPNPYPVERKIHYEVKVPVPEPFPVERHIPVNVRIPIGVPQPFPVEKHVHYPVEVKVDRPRPIPVSKHYPVPVIKPVPYPVVKERPVPVEVKVDRPVPYPVYQHVPYEVKVHVPQPYPIEKKVPYTVVKNVPYPVEIPVERPVPIHVERHVEPIQTYSFEHKEDSPESVQADESSERIDARRDGIINVVGTKEDQITNESKVEKIIIGKMKTEVDEVKEKGGMLKEEKMDAKREGGEDEAAKSVDDDAKGKRERERRKRRRGRTGVKNGKNNS